MARRDTPPTRARHPHPRRPRSLPPPPHRHRYAAALHRAAERYRPGSLTILRVSVGVIYCWFGILKLFPATSPAEHIAIRTMTKLTGGLVPAQASLPLLGTAETLIGLALVTGILLRHALAAFYAHMSGVLSSLILLPDAMWHHGIPTLDGQYVLKNLVLIAACLAVTADELTS
ncbi:DoxX family protein [Streptomyces sp. NPDC002343]